MSEIQVNQMLFHLFSCKISILSYVFILLMVLKYLYSSKGCVRYRAAHFLFHAGLLFSAILCFPLFLISPRNAKNATYYSHYIGRHFSYFYGVTWNLRGGHHLSENKNGVIVANHQHELDIIGMFSIWYALGDGAPIAKRQLFWSPPGFFAWLGGTVFINRENPKTAHKSLNDTISVLKKGTKIFIFPEGTRNTNFIKTKKFLPFKKGAFRIAIEAQVPIIPLLFSPFYFLDDEQKVLDLGGEILTTVLPPISTSGLTLNDTDRLLKEVQEAMEKEYLEVIKELKVTVIPKIKSAEKRTQYLERIGEANS